MEAAVANYSLWGGIFLGRAFPQKADQVLFQTGEESLMFDEHFYVISIFSHSIQHIATFLSACVLCPETPTCARRASRVQSSRMLLHMILAMMTYSQSKDFM